MVIFHGEDVSGDVILKRAQDRFNLSLAPEFASSIHFIKLRSRYLIEEASWPRLTLLGQAIGSMVLAGEAFGMLAADDFVDSHGLGFMYPVCKFLSPSTQVVSYTHYPFIQASMMARAQTAPKRLYNQLVYSLYAWCGRAADQVMANSTWTKRHLDQIWQVPAITRVVYPPASVAEFEQIPLDPRGGRDNLVVSIGQFRPEKDHLTQI